MRIKNIIAWFGLMLVLIILELALVCNLASAEVNTTISITTDTGNINTWVNSNSGNGTTNYYLDGVDYRNSLKDASNRRKSIPLTISSAFMTWTYQGKGKYGWQESDFSTLGYAYQRLRFVLETWFVPRAELKQIIKRQQQQINQLQLEVASIEKGMNQDVLCKARQKVMVEQGLSQVTCGNQTYFNDKNVGVITIN